MAAKEFVQVERFWVPTTESLVLNAEGLLLAPRRDPLANMNPEAVALSDLDEVPCLVLLGDPGMGKSTAISQHVVALRCRDPGRHTALIDLKEVGATSALRSALDGDPNFSAWRMASGVLDLFLDSLDETVERLETTAMELGRLLAEFDKSRVRVRIACRSVLWSEALAERLKSHWGKIEIRELAPLCTSDVDEWARSRRVDPEDFREWLTLRAAGPLAARPITLELLFRLYSQGEEGTVSHGSVFEDGCRLLAEENDDTRQERRHTGDLTATKRLQIASRIAALLLLSGKSLIQSRSVQDAPVPNAITIDQLIGESLDPDSARTPVGKSEVLETLQTALFTIVGERCLSFSHRTFAEFLAGRYLVRAGLSLQQLRSVLCDGSPERRVVPQLREVAAWVGSARPDFRKHVLASDPEILLSSDLTAVEAQVKLDIASAVLAAVESGRLSIFEESLRVGFPRLATPELASVLDGVLGNTSHESMTRLAAADMARVTKTRSLSRVLSRIALDPTEEYPLRVRAALGVLAFRLEVDLLALKDLLTRPPAEDPQDELRGIALEALWPLHLSADELVRALAPRQDPSLFGMYNRFLISCKVEPADDARLMPLLEWVRARMSGPRASGDFEALADSVCEAALDERASPQGLAVLADVALRRGEAHAGLFLGHAVDNRHERLTADRQARFRLIEAVVRAVGAAHERAVNLAWLRTPILAVEELALLLEEVVPRLEEAPRRALGRYIRSFVQHRGVSELESLWSAATRDPVLGDELMRFFLPVAIQSEEADRARRAHEETREIEESGPVEVSKVVSESYVQGSLREELAKSNAGDLERWWRFCYLLMVEPGKARFTLHDYQWDIKVLPGWDLLSIEDRGAAIEVARKVLAEEADPVLLDPLDEGSPSRRSLAWIKALALVQGHDENTVRSLQGDAIRRAQSLLFTAPGDLGQEEKSPWADLLERVYRLDPGQGNVWVRRAIQRGRGREVLSVLRPAWHPGLSTLVLEELHLASEMHRRQELLEILAIADRPAAMTEANVVLSSMGLQDAESRRNRVCAAVALLRMGGDENWTAVSSAIANDDDLGREAFLNFVATLLPSDRDLANSLVERNLADAYLVLRRLFGAREDEHPGRAGAVSPRMQVGWLRDQLLQELKKRGTDDAALAMDGIRRRLPDARWLTAECAEAWGRARRNAWRPPTPESVARLSVSRGARLVQSEEQLLDVVLESILRLETALHSETPAVYDLWEHCSKDTYRPCDETHLSDYLKRHLDRDLRERGVIVNREVEISCHPSRAPGPRTDIHVDAVLQRPHQEEPKRLTVIIEVKGSWNPDVRTSLRTQLEKRYLKSQPRSCGLYLVGLFSCTGWKDPRDRRRRGLPWGTPAGARRALSRQSEAATRALGGRTVKAYVLDARLPSCAGQGPPSSRRSQKGRRRQKPRRPSRGRRRRRGKRR